MAMHLAVSSAVSDHAAGQRGAMGLRWTQARLTLLDILFASYIIMLGLRPM